ncbi:hypothetical protein [Planococcus sp. S3-L1]|uniref:hypothetical protein n=1 Tax=Planococcus sp. S3-L1 TaxID=3046200 RepID=UPI0024B92C86|nr:hypothetical protein [Planococcus sp. S3-L1]MDJ0331725.1 hypothetical protein [Planococcus sp. S3-L1]
MKELEYELLNLAFLFLASGQSVDYFTGFIETFEKKEAIPKGTYFDKSFTMQKKIRNLYPEWTNYLNRSNYNLIMTNDMDSLLSCMFLKHHFGLEINSFYSFYKMSKINLMDQREPIGVDCALKENKCFDNHMVRLDEFSYINVQSANINNVSGVHRERYTDKFAMSTLIQLYAIYDIPLPETIQGKMIILCCDVGFKGYYDERYRDTFLSYLEKFEMMELVEILEAYTIDDMYWFMLRAEMDINIRLNQSGKNKDKLSFESSGNNPDLDARLADKINLDWYSEHLGFPVDLPEASFETVEKFTASTIEWHELNTKRLERAFSYAFINKRKIMISERKESHHETT